MALRRRGSLAAGCFLLVPFAGSFGQTAQTRASSSAASSPVGSTLAVTLQIDLSGASAPNHTLGAYDGFFRWNPAVLQYQSKVEPSFGSPLTNVNNAASGSLRFANFSSSGPQGNTTILTLVFRVLASGASPLDIDVQAVTSGSLRSLAVQNSDATFTGTGGSPPADIGLSISNLSLTSTAGAQPPGAQSFQISNAGGGTLTWTVSDDVAWLGTSPTTGTNAGTVTLSATTAGMAPGTYSGLVTVSAVGATSRTLGVTLTLSATTLPPTVGVSPSAITFSATAGAATPDPQSFQVSNAGSGTLAWSVNVDAPWLTATPATGANTGTVMLTANTAGMAAGSYNAMVTVSAAGASSQAVAVTLNLSSAPVPPAIGVAPAALTFAATAGGPAPTPQILEISNAGGGTLSWSATSDAGWLAVTPTSGTAPASVTVTAATAGLEAGSHTGTITLIAPDVAPTAVPVTLTVSAPTGGGGGGGQGPLSVSTNSLIFYATIDGRSTPQTVRLDTADSTMTWTTSSTQRWITATPPGGRGPATLTVSLQLRGGTPGIFDGQLRIAPTSGSDRSPQIVDIRLIVSPTPGSGGPGAPLIAVGPGSLHFLVAPFGTLSAPETFNLSNAGGGTLNWSVEATEPWIRIGQANGSGNNQIIEIRVDPSGLATGFRTGQVRVSAEGASNNPVSVDVTVTVSGGGGGARSRLNVDATSPGSERRIDGYDVVAMIRGIEAADARFDVNEDGTLDAKDLDLVLSSFGKIE